MKQNTKKILLSLFFLSASKAAFSFTRICEIKFEEDPVAVVEFRGRAVYLTEISNEKNKDSVFMQYSFSPSVDKLLEKIEVGQNIKRVKCIKDKLYMLVDNRPFTGIKPLEAHKDIHLVSLEEKTSKDFICIDDEIYVMHGEKPYLTKISIETAKPEEIQGLPDLSGLDRIFSYDGKLLTLEHKRVSCNGKPTDYCLNLYDLKTFKVLNSTEVAQCVEDIAIDGNKAYVLDTEHNRVIVIELNDFDSNKTSISVPDNSKHILVKDRILYINFSESLDQFHGRILEKEIHEEDKLAKSLMRGSVRVINLDQKYAPVTISDFFGKLNISITENYLYLFYSDYKKGFVHDLPPSFLNIRNILTDNARYLRYFDEIYYQARRPFRSDENNFSDALLNAYEKYKKSKAQPVSIKEQPEEKSNCSVLYNNNFTRKPLNSIESIIDALVDEPIRLIADVVVEAYEQYERSELALLSNNDSLVLYDHNSSRVPLGLFETLPVELIAYMCNIGKLDINSIIKLSQTSKGINLLLNRFIIDRQLEKYIHWAWLAQGESQALISELTEAIRSGNPMALKLAEQIKQKVDHDRDIEVLNLCRPQ